MLNLMYMGNIMLRVLTQRAEPTPGGSSLEQDLSGFDSPYRTVTAMKERVENYRM